MFLALLLLIAVPACLAVPLESNDHHSQDPSRVDKPAVEEIRPVLQKMAESVHYLLNQLVDSPLVLLNKTTIQSQPVLRQAFDHVHLSVNDLADHILLYLHHRMSPQSHPEQRRNKDDDVIDWKADEHRDLFINQLAEHRRLLFRQLAQRQFETFISRFLTPVEIQKKK